jgi:putative ABC transport system permease protein
MNPPRLALALLHVLIPARFREVITGDLEEEWHTAPRPSRLRFWNLTLRSILACWLDRLTLQSPRRADLHTLDAGDRPMQSLMQDLRYGVRLMWRAPGFTLAAVATLALGIGANSAIFSLLNVVSLKPLPYHDPSRVAFLAGWDLEDGDMVFNVRLADYLDLRQRTRSFADLSAYTYLSANLTGGDMPERVQAYRVTSNTFSMLGVSAALGRTFAASDESAGRQDVAVMSHGLWQRRFGSDPSVIGRTIVLNGQPYEIVGVMPRRFEFPVFNFKGDLWIPWSGTAVTRGEDAALQSATVVGRLRSEVTYTGAQAELDVAMAQLADAYPQTNRSLGARLIEMGRLDEEEMGAAPAIILATVALVLLLACANVANLLLSRGAARHRELAVRAALGASRLRIGRQLLIEGVLLALAGGTAGLLLAMLALEALRAALPEMMLTTMPNINELGVDTATLLYTLIISLLTSVVFGLVPAWRASLGGFQDGLKEGTSAGGSRGTRRLRTALVIAEVALSTVLLVAAGLLIRSHRGVQRVDPGFAPQGVLTMALTLPDHKYTLGSKRLQFYDSAIERISHIPGVHAAGAVNVLPFSTYDRGSALTVEGAPAVEAGREPRVSYRIASLDYFNAMRIPVTEGRSFDGNDRTDAPLVAMVNRTLTRRLLADGSPIGRRVRFGTSTTAPWLTIVGVVGDVYHSQLTREPSPEIYVPMAQAPVSMMMLAVRTDGRPEDFTRSVLAELHAIDPEQAVYHVKTLDELVANSMLGQSTSAVLMTVFGALALLLAGVGVYGVVAYAVSLQTKEFGVRIALGATSRDLLRLVLRSGLIMIGAGIVIGIAGALGASRLMTGALFGVGPADPVTYIVVVLVLTVTGLLACTVPAVRASRTEPLLALRAE